MDESNWIALIGIFALVAVVFYMVVVCMFVPFL
jgi:hypothetical protein